MAKSLLIEAIFKTNACRNLSLAPATFQLRVLACCEKNKQYRASILGPSLSHLCNSSSPGPMLFCNLSCISFFLRFIYLWLCWVFVAVHRLLIAVASLVVEHRLQACGLQQLQHRGSVIVIHGPQNWFSSCGAWGFGCSAACGNFPDQGLTSVLCIGRWILNHQESPCMLFLNT